MACLGLATHPLSGLYAQCLLSTAYITEKLKNLAQSQFKQTTCPALPQHPVQAPPSLLRTAETAFHLAAAHGMPRAGHSHTGIALCTVVAKRRLQNWEKKN